MEPYIKAILKRFMKETLLVKDDDEENFTRLRPLQSDPILLRGYQSKKYTFIKYFYNIFYYIFYIFS